MKPGKGTWIKLRHKIVHRIVFYPVKILFYIIYGLQAELFVDKGKAYKQPYLILGNHTTPLDSMCLGTSFGFPIYYVASDHVLRAGWIFSRLLSFLVAPIPIVKSRLDLQTIKDMMTVAGQGGSICLFPEGNRSYNGETIPFPVSVAKLAKKLRATLLLYRFEGGYLTAPRWASSIRRGRFTGRVVRVVTVEDMDGMSVQELYLLIKSELYENAYERQAVNPAIYRGKRLAVALERALYLCPRCRCMATMKSRGDHFACSCGLAVRYGETGFFMPAGEGEPPFGTVLDWDRWQKETLPEWLDSRRAGSDGTGALIIDSHQKLFACSRAGANKFIGEGDFALFCDRFSFQCSGSKLDFPILGIDKVVIHGKQSLQFTAGDGITYEVKSTLPRSALKYMNLFYLLRYRDGDIKNGLFSL